jgi:protein-S-isoprenylcysteine O-methyltransferase Ste14
MAKTAFREKISHLLETVFAILLFSTQTILNAGISISVMSIPLLPYLYYVLIGQTPLSALEWEIQVMLFSKMFWVGRIIALIGVAVLLFSAAQLLRSRQRGVGIMKTGMYSVVRHPQFTGIIIVTIGLTVMVLTNNLNSQFQLACLWLMQVLGYIGIARYEEWRLTKKFGDDYRGYKQIVPFLFPIKAPSWFSEFLFTISIALLISVILVLFPYDLIRIT